MEFDRLSILVQPVVFDTPMLGAVRCQAPQFSFSLFSQEMCVVWVMLALVLQWLETS